MNVQRKLKQKCISVLVALSMVLTLLGMPWDVENVRAEEPGSEPVKYLYYEWDDTEKRLNRKEGNVTEYEIFSGSLSEIGSESGKWYVVVESATVNSRITVNGTANLILKDGCELKVNDGIDVTKGNSLNIYAQSEGEDCGKLSIDKLSMESSAGIGGGDGKDGGEVNINGGIVTVTNYGHGAAGIGGGFNGAGGTVTINGGTVTATSVDGGAGIGGGFIGAGGKVTINGGTVTATGNLGGAGIGGGYYGAGGTVTISGGTVTATGGFNGAGIGGGYSGAGGTVTISGGTVTATGSYGAGIGGGDYGDDCTEINIAEGMCVRSSEGASYVAGTTKSLAGTVYVMPDCKYIDYTVNADNSLTRSEKTASELGKVNYLVGSGTTSFDYGTYIAVGDVTVNSRISVIGTANLILADGCELTVKGGIDVWEGHSLNIYAQSEGEKCGKLNVTDVADGNAGIGGTRGAGGTVTINGGTVTATGGIGGAGIGGGCFLASAVGFNGGTVTINGGNVTATGGGGGAGIGGGEGGDGDTVTINGGIVIANGGRYGGAGIGGGAEGTGGKVTINGGKVTATGGIGGAGIGGGVEGAGGTVTINGGTVTATSGEGGAGIGGGYNGADCSEINIAEGMCVLKSDGTVSANWSEKSIQGTAYVVQDRYIDYELNNDYSISKKTTANLPETISIISSATTSFADGVTYVAIGDVTVNSRISVSGTANLILADGCNLTVKDGINLPEENSLNIYAQSEGENCGRLNVTAVDNNIDAGIGGEGNKAGGKVTINGGIVTTSGVYGAGIGGGQNGAGGIVTMISRNFESI